MLPLAGDIVDWSGILEVIWTSLLAGIGVTAIFAVAIVGAARAADMQRDHRVVAATLYALLMGVSFIAVLAAVVFGIIVMTDK